MISAERRAEQVVCSNPKELRNLYDQWKSPESVLDLVVNLDRLEYKRPTERLNSFIFGMDLAQQKFPIAVKFSQPPIVIIKSNLVEKAALSIYKGTLGITVSQQWIETLDLESPPSTEVINYAVEEQAHWVEQLALKEKKGENYIAAKNRQYSNSLRKYKRLRRTISELHATAEQSQMLKAAFFELISDPSEHMGIIWKAAVADAYYPWSIEAKNAKEQLETIVAHKRQKSREKRAANQPNL